MQSYRCIFLPPRFVSGRKKGRLQTEGGHKEHIHVCMRGMRHFFVLSFLFGLCKKCGHPLHLLLRVYPWVSEQTAENTVRWAQLIKGVFETLLIPRNCETAGRVKPHMLFFYFCLFSCLIFEILKYGLIWAFVWQYFGVCFKVLLSDPCVRGRLSWLGVVSMLTCFSLIICFQPIQSFAVLVLFCTLSVDNKSAWIRIVCWQFFISQYFCICVFFFCWHHI